MNRREAEELLPWYVAGTLSADEARGVEAFIASGEIPKAALDELALLRESVAEVGAEEPAYDPSLLDRAMARLDSVPQFAPQDPIIVRAPTARAGVGARLLDWLQWPATPPLARIAIAVQLLVVVALGAVLLVRPEGVAPPGYEVAGIARNGDFTIAFVADASEAEVRTLLVDCDAEIVAGPSALGVYTIAIEPDADATANAARLRASPLVSLLEPVPR